METINFKKSQIKNFKLLSDNFSKNIVLMDNKGEVIKIFKGDKKEEKLKELNNINLSESFVLPNNFISVDDKLLGYSMKYISNETAENLMFKSKKEKIAILKKIKEIINEAHEKGYILGNIYSNNFLLKNGNPYLCDMDDAVLKDNFLSDNNHISNKYLKYHDLDKNIDTFLFNVLAMSILTRRIPCAVFSKSNMENTEFMKNKNLKKFYENFLNYPNDNYEQEDILEYLSTGKKKKFHL